MSVSAPVTPPRTREVLSVTTGREAPQPRRGRGRPSRRRLIQPVVALLLVVVLLGVPFWMVIVTAGKNQAEALQPNLALPSRWQLFENVASVFDDGRMLPAFLGSMLIMVPSVVGVLLLGAMASWVLARR